MLAEHTMTKSGVGEQLLINQWSRHYHLAEPDDNLVRSVSEILDRIIEHELPHLLPQQGLGPEQQVCIRRLAIQLGYFPSSSRKDSTQSWTQQISEQVCRILSAGGSNVIRYASPLHALAEFACDVSQGKLDRSWAWAQLDLISVVDSSSLIQARRQLVVALIRQPNIIMPVMIHLAKNNNLLQLLSNLEQEDCQALFEQALLISGKTERVLSERSAPVNHFLASGFDAFELYPRSILLQHLKQNLQLGFQCNISATSWALAILLEVQPACFVRPASQINRIVSPLRDALLALGIKASSGFLESLTAPEAKTLHDIEQKTTSRTAKNKQVDKDKPVLSDAKQIQANRSFDTPDCDHHQSDTRQVISAESGLGNEYAQQTKKERGNSLNEIHPSGIPDTAEYSSWQIDNWSDSQFSESMVIGKKSVESQWAGMVFVIPLLQAEENPFGEHKMSLIKQLLRIDAFSQRTASWILYQFFYICFRLADLDETCIQTVMSDPIVGLLCGLPEDKNTIEFDHLSTVEGEVIEEHVNYLFNDLASLLGKDQRHTLWVDMCHRHAVIVIDELWTELHFPLDSVDTNIRRAGLDLDPGYVQWLGKVVKIRYV